MVKNCHIPDLVHAFSNLEIVIETLNFHISCIFVQFNNNAIEFICCFFKFYIASTIQSFKQEKCVKKIQPLYFSS